MSSIKLKHGAHVCEIFLSCIFLCRYLFEPHFVVNYLFYWESLNAYRFLCTAFLILCLSCVHPPPPPVTRPLYPSISTCSRQSSLTAMQLHATGLYCLFDLKCRIPWLLPTSNCDSDRTHFPKLSQVAMLIFISKGLGKLALPKKHDVNQRNHCLKFEEAQIQWELPSGSNILKFLILESSVVWSCIELEKYWQVHGVDLLTGGLIRLPSSSGTMPRWDGSSSIIFSFQYTFPSSHRSIQASDPWTICSRPAQSHALQSAAVPFWYTLQSGATEAPQAAKHQFHSSD